MRDDRNWVTQNKQRCEPISPEYGINPQQFGNGVNFSLNILLSLGSVGSPRNLPHDWGKEMVTIRNNWVDTREDVGHRLLP